MGSFHLTIWTAGDPNFLQHILNSVAMSMQDGTVMGNVQAVTILTILTILFRYVANGAKGIDAHTVVTSALIYGASFGVTVPVIVSNPTTNQTYTVSNVPFGPAGIGALLSNIGLSITNVSQLAFSTPTSAQAGWMGGLDTLRIVRENTTRGGQVAQSGDLSGAWQEYISQCIVRSLTPQLQQNLYNTVGPATLPDAINTFGQKGIGVLNFPLAAPSITALTNDTSCAGNTYNDLLTQTDSIITTSIAPGVLAPALGITSSNAANDALDQLTQALAAIGLDSVSGQQFIEATIAARGWDDATVYVAKQLWLDYPLAKSLEDTIRQRNDLWNAEGFLFGSMAKSMATIIECLIYGATPILAVLLLTGSMAMQATIKWGQMALWLQFWNPLFAIINYYMAMTTATYVSSMGTYAQPLSLMWLQSFFDPYLQSQLALGDKAAAAVPFLAMALAWGTSKGVEAIAGNFGQGQYEAKKTSPDSLAPAAQYTLEAGSFKAGAMGGFDSVGSSLIGVRTRDIAASEQSAGFTQARNVVSTTGASWNQSIADAVTSGTTGTSTTSMAVRAAQEKTSAYARNHQTGRDFAERYAHGDQQVATDVAAVRTAIEGGAKIDAGETVSKLMARWGAAGMVTAEAAGMANSALGGKDADGKKKGLVSANLGITHGGSAQVSATDQSTQEHGMATALTQMFQESTQRADTKRLGIASEMADQLANTSGVTYTSTNGRTTTVTDAESASQAQSVQAAEKKMNMTEASRTFNAYQWTKAYTEGAKTDGGQFNTAFRQATQGMDGLISPNGGKYWSEGNHRAALNDFLRADPSGTAARIYAFRDIVSGGSTLSSGISASRKEMGRALFDRGDQSFLGAQSTASGVGASIQQESGFVGAAQTPAFGSLAQQGETTVTAGNQARGGDKSLVDREAAQLPGLANDNRGSVTSTLGAYDGAINSGQNDVANAGAPLVKTGTDVSDHVDNSPNIAAASNKETVGGANTFSTATSAATPGFVKSATNTAGQVFEGAERTTKP
ncbi:MAG: conjugal transfer protein TraG [Desulfovibrio sp.]|uniref:conjugal transfer protein TraG N-terminal domain-containing protein n=1 Tax=Desulfovibrio sp. TaxID=885 RepID=UPI00135D9C03|nr:conjugal transfer protein TraG N-terminal domain-containing protein [Desulfovibrio sp.]MTJ93934.1 conjugal transfer protein TraG [Desulfovibrio sp.]